MSLLSEQDAQRATEAIRQVEQHTDAELVTVVAQQADDYHYIPTLWAALIALISPALALLTPFWLDIADVLGVQVVVFLAVALLFRLPWIMHRLIPRSVKEYRAANLARRMFLENNLHHTKDATGVLIFVSEAERYVEIIADQGINDRVAAGAWEGIVTQFSTACRQGVAVEGLIDMINACGALLQEHVPGTETKNELPNHLVLL